MTVHGTERVEVFSCLSGSCADAETIARANGHDPNSLQLDIDPIHAPKVLLYFDWADKNIQTTCLDYCDLKKKYKEKIDFTLSEFERARYNRYVVLRREELTKEFIDGPKVCQS